jgi:hypothetical protein
VVHVGGEGDDFADAGVEVDEVEAVVGAEQGVEEVVGGVDFDVEVFADGAAGIDGEDEGKGHVGLALEVGDFLGDAVFGEGEVVLSEAADGVARGVGDVDEDVDEADFYVEGGGLLGCGRRTGGLRDGGEGEEGKESKCE